MTIRAFPISIRPSSTTSGQGSFGDEPDQLRRQGAAHRSRRLRRARRAADRRHRDRAGSRASGTIACCAATSTGSGSARAPTSRTAASSTSIRRGPGHEAGHPTLIGDDVLIGHMAMVHGCLLHDRAFVGLGAIVMDGCEIESDAMLAAGALLTQGKRIPAGQLWAGRPAKYVRDLGEADLAGHARWASPIMSRWPSSTRRRSAAEAVDPRPAGRRRAASASAIAVVERLRGRRRWSAGRRAPERAGGARRGVAWSGRAPPRPATAPAAPRPSCPSPAARRAPRPARRRRNRASNAPLALPRLAEQRRDPRLQGGVVGERPAPRAPAPRSISRSSGRGASEGKGPSVTQPASRAPAERRGGRRATVHPPSLCARPRARNTGRPPAQAGVARPCPSPYVARLPRARSSAG